METADLPALAPPEPKTWHVRIEDGMITSFAPVKRRIRGGEYFTGSVIELAHRYYTQMTPEADALLAREICKAVAVYNKREAHIWFNSLMSRWSNHFPACNQNQERERKLAYSVRAIIYSATHQDWKRPTVAQIIKQYADDHSSANIPNLRTISRRTVERILDRWETLGIVQIDHASTRAEDDREYGDSWRRNHYDWNLALVPASGGTEAHYLTSQERNVDALCDALSDALSDALCVALTSPTVPAVHAVGTVSEKQEGSSTKINNDLVDNSLPGANGGTSGGQDSLRSPASQVDSAPMGRDDKARSRLVAHDDEYEAAEPFLAWLWDEDGEPRVSLLRSKHGNRQRRTNANSLKMVKLTSKEKSALLDEKRRAGLSLHEYCQQLHDTYLDPAQPDLFDHFYMNLPMRPQIPERKLMFWMGKQSRANGETPYFWSVDKREERIVSDEKLVKLSPDDAKWLKAIAARWNEGRKHPQYTWCDDANEAYKALVSDLYDKYRDRPNESVSYFWREAERTAARRDKAADTVTPYVIPSPEDLFIREETA